MHKCRRRGSPDGGEVARKGMHGRLACAKGDADAPQQECKVYLDIVFGKEEDVAMPPLHPLVEREEGSNHSAVVGVVIMTE